MAELGYPNKKNRGSNKHISPMDLADALIVSQEQEMEKKIALDLSNYIFGFFGYQDRMVDNILTPEDRNLFYMFEDCNLLSTGTEETTLHDGRDWRIHYWRFNVNKIKMASEAAKEKTESEYSIYNDVFSKDIWTKRNKSTI